MTIYPPRPNSFTCAICGTFRDWGVAPPGIWAWSAEYDIPPICVNCERTWGKAIGGWGDRNRDRRIIRQIMALASALDASAHEIQNRNGRRHATA